MLSGRRTRLHRVLDCASPSGPGHRLVPPSRCSSPRNPAAPSMRRPPVPTPRRHILEKGGFRFVGFRMGEETDRYVPTEVADFVLEYAPAPFSTWQDALTKAPAARTSHT